MSGTKLFLTAVRSVLHNPWDALKVIWLPFVIGLGVYLWAERALDQDGTGYLLATFTVDTLMLPLVAVGWHRFQLIQDPPGPLGVQTEPTRLLKYTFDWLVLGLVVGLVIMAMAAAILLPLYMFVLTDAISLALEAFTYGEFNEIFVVLTFAVIWAFTWGFFRIALRLPHQAISTTSDPLPSSWAATKTLEPAIAGCAAWAALGTMVLFAPSLWTYDLLPDAFIFAKPLPDPETYDTYDFSLQFLALTQACWTLTTLFGAAILTEIYRETTPHFSEA